jgi:signal transduction histidine kinase
MPEWNRDSGLTELLKKLPQLICIPLISADHLPDDPEKPRFIGLIDLHVVKVGDVQQPDDRLLFIGRLTAAAFLRARSYERYKIIQELNKIAIDLVNPTDRSRLEERKDAYLEKVKQVILNAVQANCLSIFEADESRDLIRCVATTGIKGHNKFKKTVYYRKDEGLTWNVFATGKHKLVNNIHECAEHTGRFLEKRSLPTTPDHDPLLAFPLPGQTPEGATGVIRIVERTCMVNKKQLQSFSDHDVDLIKLITHQVSPNLQMIRMQAHRDLFVERTAHQVTQPLQGVIAYASNILEGLYKSEPEKLHKKFVYIRQMARAAAGMMRSAAWASGITDFGFLEQIERHPEKLTRYFIDRIIDLQPLREHDGIKVRFVNPDEADQWGDFLVDEQFFDQAVQNLLHNAVKYSYPNTTVLLKVFRAGKELTVRVTSTGVPIDLSEPDRIFWDRERGKLASRYDQQGTGQGLYLARQILRGFGGNIELLTPIEDSRTVPPTGFPTAQRCTFQIRYPEAFPDDQDENIIRR